MRSQRNGERIRARIKEISKNNTERDIKQNIGVDNQVITTNSLQNALLVSTACVVSAWEVLECDN